MSEAESQHEDWKSLQELQVVGQGPSSTTLAVKKSTWTKEDVDRFNIDHYVSHNEALNQSQIKSTLSSIYQEHSIEQSAQLGVQGEGSLKELRKALGELALLQTLTSALRENTSYALKDTYGQEFDKSSLEVPLTQEIDVMQKINSSAHQSLLLKTSAMKDNIFKRRKFEQDVMACKDHWSILCCDRRTRKVSDRPEVMAFQQDRDILAIDCFWRKRPQMYQNPYYYAFLRMNESSGNAELDPLFNQHILDASKTVFFTLQISLECISQQQELASLDLWTLLHESKAESVINVNYSSNPEYLQSIFYNCEALKHTSFARELFGNIVEEVNKVTTIVTAVSSSSSAPSSKESYPSLSKVNTSIALAEQFSLCQHSDQELQWQIAADVKLSIRLVPLTLERICTLNGPEDQTAMGVDSELLSHARHWKNLVSSMFVTLIGTFHTLLLTNQRKDEIERQWRHRSGETERQVISRRTVDAVSSTNTVEKQSMIQPQSMLTDAFRVLRVQHQKLRVLVCLREEVQSILATAGLIEPNRKDNFTVSSIHDIPNKEIDADNVPDWSMWWQHKIAPLLYHHHSLAIDVNIPLSFYNKGNTPNSTLSKVIISVLSSSKAENFLSTSWSNLEKDFLVIDVTNRASIPCPNRDETYVTRDIVATPNLATIVVQHVLSYSLSWLCYNYWAPILSTSFSWSIRPTLKRTEFALVDEHLVCASADISAKLGYCNISLWRSADDSIFMALTWQFLANCQVNKNEILSKLISDKNGYSNAMSSEIFQKSALLLGQYAHLNLPHELGCPETTFLWKN